MWRKIMEIAAKDPWAKFLNKEFIIYSFCGFLTTLVDLGVNFVCYYNLGWDAVPSNIVSNIAAVLFAFVVNKQFVFHSRDWSFKKTAKELVQFFLGRLVAVGISTGAIYVLVDLVGFPNAVCKVALSIFVVIFNYFVSKRIF